MTPKAKTRPTGLGKQVHKPKQVVTGTSTQKPAMTASDSSNDLAAGTSTLRRTYSFELDTQLAVHDSDASLVAAADQAALDALLASLHARTGASTSCSSSDQDEAHELLGYSDDDSVADSQKAATLAKGQGIVASKLEGYEAAPGRQSSDVLDLDGMGKEQDGRRTELEEYIAALKARHAEDGTSLVQFPSEFHALVTKLLADKLQEYESMRGWLPTCNRLPAEPSALSMKSEDPKIREGLVLIQKLDTKLMAKAAQAAIVERETFPDRWEKQQARKAATEQRLLEDTIQRERRRRARAARLQQALGDMDWDSDDDGKENQGGDASRLGLYASLRPDQEERVEAILAQDDDELMNNNPFDCQAAVEHAAAPLSLAEIDTRLSQYLAEHVWDADGSLADCRLSQAHAHNDDGAADQSNSSTPALRTNQLNMPTLQPAAQMQPVKGSGSSTTTSKPCSPLVPNTGSDALRAPSSVAQDSATASRGQPDYLREARLLRELAARGAELDAAIRALRTSELPQRLDADQMATLVADCRRQLEALQSRQDAPLEAAAA